MSVNEIDTFVLLFPNGEWSSTATDAQLNSVVAQLRPNISFAQTVQDGLQTLSTHDADLDGTISGFLYVPDLDIGDNCFNISKNYIPHNATRQANLPPTDFTLVAIAPWINVECTIEYMNAASLDPARAFIFYPPDNSTGQPAPSNSEYWDLQDGGAWKTAHAYPVYAVPGAIGDELMHQLSLYSGNMTNVPFGHEISELPGIDPRDYVRLYTDLSVSPTSKLPSLGVFVLVVLAVLVLVLGTTSASMHLIQRRRRRALERRVSSGEVNLEALGIKRLTVPPAMIERLPLFTYSAESEKSPLESRKTSQATDTMEREDHSGATPLPLLSPVAHVSAAEMIMIDDTKSPNQQSLIVHRFLPYSQPTCPICLEDYVSGESEIRELPCGHIFHPECIDTFLANNSSLCPMCKKSCLPVGFCGTKITNAMVRRERNLRRIRSRVTEESGDPDPEAHTRRRRIDARLLSLKRTLLHRPPFSTDTSAMPMQPQPVYMTNALPAHPTAEGQGLAPGPSRDEIVAQRIQELAATQVPIVDPDIIEQRQRPKWRRMLAHVFPGF